MPEIDGVVPGVISAVSTVLVLLLGKLYDRKAARDAAQGKATERTEDRLWARVVQLEQDRDRLADERNSCHDKLAEVTSKIATMQWQLDRMAAEVETLTSRANGGGIVGS